MSNKEWQVGDMTTWHKSQSLIVPARVVEVTDTLVRVQPYHFVQSHLSVQDSVKWTNDNGGNSSTTADYMEYDINLNYTGNEQWFIEFGVEVDVDLVDADINAGSFYCDSYQYT